MIANSRAVHYAWLLLLAIALLWFAWIGFLASDDINYRSGAIAWLTQTWFVPPTHWEARTVVTLPIAATIATLGDTEFAVTAPSGLYLVLLVVLTYHQLSKLMPLGHALISTAAIASIPVFSIHAVTASADLAEAFWAVLAFWMISHGIREVGSARGWMIAGGAAIALAFMGRETVIGLILFTGLLMIVGYRIDRRLYWYAALGFLLVAGLEAAYYAAASGDPLRRIKIILSAASGADRQTGLPPFSLDDSGALRIWNPIDSFLMFLTKHNFGLVYYALIPICALVLRDARRTARVTGTNPAWLEQARLAVVAGIVWTVFCAIVLYRIKILSRYYIVPTYLFAIAAALWTSHVLLPHRRRLVAIALTLVVAVNLLCISVDNKNPRPGERALAEYLSRSTGTVTSDPLTVARAQQFIAWAGQDVARVRSGPPRPGDVFLYNPYTATQPNRLMADAEVAQYRAQPGWERLWSSAAEPPLVGRILLALGVSGFVPPAYREKLVGARPPVVVYRVPR